MKLIQKEIESALKDSGCLEFLIRGGEAAVAGLLSKFQGTGEILSEEQHVILQDEEHREAFHQGQ